MAVNPGLDEHYDQNMVQTIYRSRADVMLTPHKLGPTLYMCGFLFPLLSFLLLLNCEFTLPTSGHEAGVAWGMRRR